MHPPGVEPEFLVSVTVMAVATVWGCRRDFQCPTSWTKDAKEQAVERRALVHPHSAIPVIRSGRVTAGALCLGIFTLPNCTQHIVRDCDCVSYPPI